MRCEEMKKKEGTKSGPSFVAPIHGGDLRNFKGSEKFLVDSTYEQESGLT